MTIYLFLGLIMLLGFLFKLFNELEDESVRNAFTGRLSWLNQRGSWKRKWKIVNGSTLQFVPTYFKFLWFKLPRKWWYFGVYPENVERFVYSSTVFVFLTDPEHGLQFIKHRMIEACFVITSLFLCRFVEFWFLVPVAWWVGVKLFVLIKVKLLKSVC